MGESSKLSSSGTSVTPVSEKELVEQAYMVHYLYKSEPIVLHSGQGAFCTTIVTREWPE